MDDFQFSTSFSGDIAGLVANILAGEATPEERMRFDRWLTTDPDAAKRYAALRNAWSRREAAAFQKDPQQFVARVHRSIQTEGGVATPANKSRRDAVPVVAHRIRWLGALAGVVTGALVIGGVLRWYPNATSTLPSAEQHQGDYRTNAGQRAQFRLPDGSVVVLGPESRLRVAEGFGMSSRTLWLEGQALFTVTHHTAAPFIIRAGTSETRVLGTSFTVRKYPDDPQVRVLVAQGKVSLNATVLGNGDLGIATDAEPARITHDVSTAPELAWTEGNLVFNKVLLRDVIRDLERWYGVRVVVKDPDLLSQPIITTLSVEGSREAFSLLAMALDARVAFEGSTVTLSAR